MLASTYFVSVNKDEIYVLGRVEGSSFHIYQMNCSKGMIDTWATAKLDEESVVYGVYLSYMSKVNKVLVVLKVRVQLLYAWLSLDEGLGSTLLLSSLFSSMATVEQPAPVLFGHQCCRIALCLHLDGIKLSEEIKSTSISFISAAATWVTDHSVFRNYVAADAERVVGVAQYALQDQLVLIHSEDVISKLSNISWCEINWSKNKVHVHWRLPVMKHRVSYAFAESGTPTPVAVIGGRDCIWIVDSIGEMKYRLQLSEWKMASFGALPTMAKETTLILSDMEGNVRLFKVVDSKLCIISSNFHDVLRIEESLLPFQRIFPFSMQKQGILVVGVCGPLNQLISSQRTISNVVRKLAQELSFCERSSFQLQGLHDTKVMLAAAMESFSIFGLLESGFPLSPCISASFDISGLGDVQLLPVVGSSCHVVLTSRIARISSLLSCNEDSLNRLEVDICEQEETIASFLLLRNTAILQMTPSFLCVASLAPNNGKSWRVNFSDLVAACKKEHRAVYNVTALFAVLTADGLEVSCSDMQLRIVFAQNQLLEGPTAIKQTIVQASNSQVAGLAGLDEWLFSSRWESCELEIVRCNSRRLFRPVGDEEGYNTVVKPLSCMKITENRLLLALGISHSLQVYIVNIDEQPALLRSFDLETDSVSTIQSHELGFMVLTTKGRMYFIDVSDVNSISTRLLWENHFVVSAVSLGRSSIVYLVRSAEGFLQLHMAEYVHSMLQSTRLFWTECKMVPGKVTTWLCEKHHLSFIAKTKLDPPYLGYFTIEGSKCQRFGQFTSKSGHQICAISESPCIPDIPFGMGSNDNEHMVALFEHIGNSLMLQVVIFPESRLVGQIILGNCSTHFLHKVVTIAGGIKVLCTITSPDIMLDIFGWCVEENKQNCTGTLSLSKLCSLDLKANCPGLDRIHSLYSEGEFLLINFVDGHFIAIQIRLESVSLLENYSAQIIAESAVPRPIRSIFVFSKGSNPIHVQDRVFFLAYSNCIGFAEEVTIIESVSNFCRSQTTAGAAGNSEEDLSPISLTASFLLPPQVVKEMKTLHSIIAVSKSGSMTTEGSAERYLLVPSKIDCVMGMEIQWLVTTSSRCFLLVTT
eukprot:scaffold1869_cov163-Ochromonas_danica.AAC.20